MVTGHPRRDSEQLCATLAQVVAAKTGTDPETMSPPLYSAVDPEALAALVDSPADVTVTFTYDGHEVVVLGDGSIRVDGTWCDSLAASEPADARCAEGRN